MFKRFLLLLIPLSFISAQKIDATVTDEKKRLLVLASNKNTPKDAIERKVSKVVAEVASKLGRYEVIDRNNLETILDELARKIKKIMTTMMTKEGSGKWWCMKQ